MPDTNNREYVVEHSELEAKKQKHSGIFAKILCVFVAFCMWLYVMAVESPEFEQTFSHIPVELVGTEELVDKGLAIYNGYGTLIDVTLSGKKSVLSQLNEKDIVATVNVAGITDQSSRHSCRISVDVPAGCKLVGMSQDVISVYLDKAEQISVDIAEIRDNTNLPAGCYTGTIEFPFDNVTVTGPSAILSKVDKAIVNIDMSGIKNSTVVTKKIYLADKNGTMIESPYVDFYPREMTFEIPIIKTVEVPIEVDFKYDFLNESNANVSIFPSVIQITGDREIIEKGDLLSKVIVDEKLDFENNRCQKLVIPESVPGVSLSTNRIEVIVGIDSSIKTRQISVPSTNIRDTGGKPGVKYDWDKSSIVVTIMGDINAISKINSEDIMLTFDMSPFSSSNTGTVRVRADVEIDSAHADDVIEVGTYDINVTFR